MRILRGVASGCVQENPTETQLTAYRTRLYRHFRVDFARTDSTTVHRRYQLASHGDRSSDVRSQCVGPVLSGSVWPKIRVQLSHFAVHGSATVLGQHPLSTRVGRLAAPPDSKGDSTLSGGCRRASAAERRAPPGGRLANRCRTSARSCNYAKARWSGALASKPSSRP